MYSKLLLVSISVSLILGNVYSFKSRETVQQFYQYNVIAKKLNKYYNTNFCGGDKKIWAAFCEDAFEYLGGNENKSPYRHIYPNYIFYEDIGAARKCRTIPVHFDYEFKINSEPIAEQLMAKCVSRPAVFKENENISEQKAAISELAIYIQENVMIIFEYYRRADNTTFAVPFEWFIIYQYSKAPLPDILFTTLPPQRFGRSPVTHKKFKNRLKYLQNRQSLNTVSSLGSNVHTLRRLCILALETEPEFQFLAWPGFYERSSPLMYETIVFGEDSNENYKTIVYPCFGSIDLPTKGKIFPEIKKPKYVISQGMDNDSMILHEFKEYKGFRCYVPIDMIYNIIPEFVIRVYTYDGLNMIT